jgi:hypothetical protein
MVLFGILSVGNYIPSHASNAKTYRLNRGRFLFVRSARMLVCEMPYPIDRHGFQILPNQIDTRRLVSMSRTVMLELK